MYVCVSDKQNSIVERAIAYAHMYHMSHAHSNTDDDNYAANTTATTTCTTPTATTTSPARQMKRSIEVLQIEGHTLLGVPATSRVQNYKSFIDPKTGRKNQLLIAMHDSTGKAKGGGGGGLSAEAESAVIRSGVQALSKQVCDQRSNVCMDINTVDVYVYV